MSEGKMRAVAIDRFGGPDVLSVRDFPIPEIKPNEILIRVASAGVGIWDIAEREGLIAKMYSQMYGIKSSFPYVIGSEGAGTIVKIGKEVEGFRNGDLVYGDIRARDPKAGFYAEYTAVDVERTSRVPSNLTVDQAGALPIDGATALRGLDVLGVRAGEKLMIFGASGGIGHLAIQLAKRMGVEVFAVASGEDGMDLARRSGAQAVVDGHTGDVQASAKEFAPEGFDAALLTVQAQNPRSMKEAENVLGTVRQGGRVACPYWSARAPKAPPGVLMLPYGLVDDKGKALPGLMSRLNDMIEAGPFEVHLDRKFSLDQVVDAHQALTSHHVGRFVILPTTL